MKKNALKIPIKKIKKSNIASNTKDSVKGFNRHFPLGKKKEKNRQQKLEEQMRKFNPKLYYGVKNT
tara:strand:+ start:259 stop:456 length:198 start_codon:yes stop_codon:yes gene_type:complete